jgi:hypothetical protein
VTTLGSTRVSRVGFGVALKRTFGVLSIVARNYNHWQKFANPRWLRQHARRMRYPNFITSILLKFAAASR